MPLPTDAPPDDDEAALLESLRAAVAILQETHIVDGSARLKLARALVRLAKTDFERAEGPGDRQRLAESAVRHVLASSAPADRSVPVADQDRPAR